MIPIPDADKAVAIAAIVSAIMVLLSLIMKKGESAEQLLLFTLSPRIDKSLLSVFQFYYYMTIRFISLAVCFHKTISLKSRMDDPSLIRIHRFQRYRSSSLSYLIGNASGQIFQSFFSPVSVILCIQLHPDISLSSFVYHKTGKVLKGVQCLSSLS